MTRKCLFAASILLLIPGGVSAANAPAANDSAAIVRHYAEIGHAKFEDALIEAKALDGAIAALVSQPDAARLDAARAAWRAARVPYLQSEAYRFGNPVLDAWEPRVNSWPLDEGLIDYVAPSYGTESDENEFYIANIIANPKLTVGGVFIDATMISPELLAKTLRDAGQVEANVATGYHALEFMLWGQDLNGNGPGAGDRPASDFDTANCTHGNCDRRIAYLKSASSLLVTDLAEMEAAWRPEGAAAKAVTDGPVKGLSAILTGMGSLSYGELAGERMKLGLLLHDPEEEQDCFSDNTYRSHYYDAVGIRDVYLGQYTRIDGTEMTGPSVSALLAARDAPLDVEMRAKLDKTIAAMTAMVKRGETVEAYDQMIGEGNTEGNKIVQAAIDGLIDQTKTIERVIAGLNLGKITLEGSDSLDHPDMVPQ